jgi:hypothetical protein
MDSEHNPYQTPNRTDGLPAQTRRPFEPAEVESTKIVLYAQMLLRVLGVLLVIEGIGLTLFAIAFGVVTTRDYVESGYTVYQGLFNAYSVAYGCSGLVSLSGGLYLTMGGRWLIAALFVPPAPLRSDGTFGEMASGAEFRDSSAT